MKNPERINEIIAYGEIRFILQTGFAWGGLAAVIFSTIQYLTKGHYNIHAFIAALIICPVAGILCAKWMWKSLVKQQTKNKMPNQASDPT